MTRHAILEVFDRITTRAPFIRPIAIELFCGSGHGQAAEYASMCEYLEGWDLKEERVAEFRRNIPSARAKTCDVYTELLQPRGITEVKKFNMVCVDNSALIAYKGHFEHFDIFPGIYNIMDPARCFVVFTVYPDPYSYAEPRKDAVKKAFAKPDEFMADWDAARDKFYKLPALNPSNMPKTRPVSSLRLQDMEEIYKERFEADGWQVPYTFSCMRGRAAGYVMVEACREAIEVPSAATSTESEIQSPPSKAKAKRKHK